jgi:hypothetical protein
MTLRPPPDLDFQIFKDLAKTSFENGLRESEAFPFENAFGMNVHFVGEDDQFTRKVNEALPILRPKIQKDGIKIPNGDIAVVSVVRKAKAYDEDVTNRPVWTFDRIRELPKSHFLIENIRQWMDHDDANDFEKVRQWFAIARFQATVVDRPPLFIMIFGFMEFSDDNVMGGLCPISPDAQKALQISDEELVKMQHEFGYECSECLRQVAALAYLEENT